MIFRYDWSRFDAKFGLIFMVGAILVFNLMGRIDFAVYAAGVSALLAWVTIILAPRRTWNQHLLGLVVYLGIGSALTAALVRPWWRATVAVFVLFVMVLAWWLMLTPGNDRDWQADVARMPTATIEGSKLTIRNLRNFEYRDFAGDDKDFSRAIRVGLPPRPLSVASRATAP